MTYLCKVKIVTKSGKTFSFKWKPTGSDAMAMEPEEILLGKPYICVNETKAGKTYVPRDAIDCIMVAKLDEY